MSVARVLRCDCEHAGQDKLHGRRLRVHNKMTKAENTWRCTVCKKEKRK